MEPTNTSLSREIIFKDSKIKNKDSTQDLRTFVLKKNLHKKINEEKSIKKAKDRDSTILCRLQTYFTCFFR